MTSRALLAMTVWAVASTSAAQWTMQNSGTTADLRGIHNVGSGVAWASGTHGSVLRTVDGGTTWQTCAVPPGAEALDFRGVQGFDAKTAIVMSSGMGDLSRLYKTVDGCMSWMPVFTNPDKAGFFDGMRAVRARDHKHVDAMIAGDPVDGRFTLFYMDVPLGTGDAKLIPFPRLFCADPTQDLQLPSPTRACIKRAIGIETKALNSKAAPSVKDSEIPERYLSPIPRAGEALFAASNSSVTFDPTVWYAPNISLVTGGPEGPRFLQLRGDACAGLGCEEWVKASLPLAAGKSGGAFSVAATGRDYWKGVIVGGDYQKPDVTAGTAAFSEDEGKAWKASATLPHGYRSAVAYDEKSKTWITVGPNGTDVSTDDGRNWRAAKPGRQDADDADRNWNALSLPFVVGPHGRIAVWRGEK